MMNSSLKKKIIGFSYVMVAQIIFGTTFPFNKWVIGMNVDPVMVGFNRCWLACLFLFPLYWRMRRRISWSKTDWLRLLGIGAGAAAGAMILEFTGTKFTTASNVSLIVATESILSIYLSVWILKERLQGETLIGGFCAMFGMALVIMQDIRLTEFHFNYNLLGDILVLMSIFCWSLYTVFSKEILHRSEPVCALFFITLFAGIILGIINGFRGLLTSLPEMSTRAWLGTIYLGIFGSALGHLFYFQALKLLPASIVSLTLMTLPLFGVIFSMLLLGEKLSLTQAVGALVLMGGVGYAVCPRNEEVQH